MSRLNQSGRSPTRSDDLCGDEGLTPPNHWDGNPGLNPSGLNPFMSIIEVAAMFGRSPRTIRWWLAEGRLPHVRIGGAKFIPRVAIERLICGSGEEGGAGAAGGYPPGVPGGEGGEIKC
jgi:excisionase family DNA binding protein